MYSAAGMHVFACSILDATVHELVTKFRFGFQESIVVVENERYIRKAMEFICESILDMLHSGPCYETKLMAAKCLSHLAIALECDAKR